MNYISRLEITWLCHIEHRVEEALYIPKEEFFSSFTMQLSTKPETLGEPMCCYGYFNQLILTRADLHVYYRHDFF